MSTPADVFEEVFGRQPRIELGGQRYVVIAEDDLRRILSKVVAAAGTVVARQSYRRFTRGVVRVN